MTNYLTTYKVGDYVDIKVDGSQHKGMPFKLYHGRTGTVIIFESKDPLLNFLIFFYLIGL